MKHGIRILVVPKNEPSAIDFLFKKIDCSELNSFEHLTISEEILCSPLLEEKNGVWTRKSGILLPELSYETVSLNAYPELYAVLWIKYGTSFFRFSNFRTGRGIYLSSPPSKKSGL